MKKSAKHSKSSRRAGTSWSKLSKLTSKMPGEFKLAGVVLLLLVALYVLQLITTPSFLKSQAKSISGLVVSDTPQEQAAAAAPAATAPAAKVEAPAAATAAPTAVVQPPTVKMTPVTIIGPPKGSVQPAAFTLNIELSPEVLVCYYSVSNKGQIIWDRRMKPCRTDIPVTYCTTGTNTCKVYVEVTDFNQNIIGSDTVVYSIQ
jgi:hypothetical protein